MNEKYFDIYKFAHSTPGRFMRFGPISIIVILFLFTAQTYSSLVNAVASLGILLINEIFLSAKVTHMRPNKKIGEEEGALKSMIFSSRLAFETHNNSYGLVKSLEKRAEIKFFISKIGGIDLKNANVSKDELLNQAKELVTFMKGNYITEVDLFASYLLLSENETKFMVDKDLVNEDIINITYWTRKKYKTDIFGKNKMQFLGDGVFDSLIYGWNYELKKYTRDLTNNVFSSHFCPVITGREKEFEELTIALSKDNNSNAILVGEAGVGKESIVAYLARESFLGKVPGKIYHKKIYELMVDRLLSGAENTGQLEERLSLVLSDFMHSGNTIIFIQNIENIFGGGGFDLDMSGILYEYIKGGKVQIIGTTTPAAYAEFIENKQSARELFGTIIVDEFDEAKTLLLLAEIAENYEKYHKVKLLYSVLKQSVMLSLIYFPEKFYPGGAVNLLEEIIAVGKIKGKKTISGSDVVDLVQAKTNVVLNVPTNEEKEVLLNLENKLHERVIGQDEAITAVSNAMRRARAGYDEKARPISVFLFLGPTGVGKTETAKTLAREYFGDEKSMIRIDMSEIQTQGAINKIIGGKGSEYIVNSLTDEISKKPFSLVLLDEFEKADKNILNIFLQIFDEGKVDDSKGATISFKNSIIIATSNAGTEFVRENPTITKNELIDSLLRNNIFSPELINRFDEVILFKPLNEDETRKIANILLTESGKKLSDNKIIVEFDDSVVKKVANESYDTEFGARNVRRYIEESVEQFISKLILEDKVKKGDRVTISVDSENNFIVK